MRTSIVTAFVSTDGVMEAPGGGDHRSAGWTFKGIEFDEAAYAIKASEQDEASALLLGRRTYRNAHRCGPRWRTLRATTRCLGMSCPPR